MPREQLVANIDERDGAVVVDQKTYGRAGVIGRDGCSGAIWG
jgi:hypothetical protein